MPHKNIQRHEALCGRAAIAELLVGRSGVRGARFAVTGAAYWLSLYVPWQELYSADGVVGAARGDS